PEAISHRACAVPALPVCVEGRRLRLPSAVDFRLGRDDDLHAVVSRFALRYGFARNVGKLLESGFHAFWRYHGCLCFAGKISGAHYLAEHVGPAQAAARGPPQRPRLARGIRLWFGLQHPLYCLVAHTPSLWARDIWSYCGLLLSESSSPRMVSSRSGAGLHCHVAAVRQSRSSAMAVASRRRSAPVPLHRALYFHLRIEDPSSLDFGRER